MDTEMTTDPEPSTAVESAPAILDRARMAESADPQALSPFFTSLPLEVRKMIYAETWSLDGLRQHLYREPHGRGMAHFPCQLEGDNFGRKPTRGSEESFHAACRGGGGEVVSCDRGLMTDWNVHWPCQEHLKKLKERAPVGGEADDDDQNGQPRTKAKADGVCRESNCFSSTWSPFIAFMLGCKRLYLECSESIYDTVTFHLTDAEQAASFVNSRLRSGLSCRSLEISLRVTPLLTELYYGPDGGERAVIKGRPDPVTADDNPWQRLCDALVRASSKDVADGGGGAGLRDVHIWLDSSDLRPWHSRVYENRFFTRLMRADKAMGEFVVDVPLLPDEPEERGLPGTYLEDVPREKLPFEVRRSQRTNKWLQHINKMSHLRFTSQS